MLICAANASLHYHVILSSEDFECGLQHSERFAQFVRRLQSCDLRVNAIVYLRNQVEYCQSLYLTMLQFGVVDTFSQFVDTIVETHHFTWKDWNFSFCYTELLQRLEAAGVEVTARSFHEPLAGSLMGDFFSIVDLDPEDLGIPSNLNENPRRKVGDNVSFFCQNRYGRTLTGAEDRLIARWFDTVLNSDLVVAPDDRFRILEAFRQSNAFVLSKYAVQDFGAAKVSTAERQAGSEELHMERVFAFPDASV